MIHIRCVTGLDTALETLDKANLKPLGGGPGWHLSPGNVQIGPDFTKTRKGKFLLIFLTRREVGI